MKKRMLQALLLLMLAVGTVLLAACDPVEPTKPSGSELSTKPSPDSSASQSTPDPTGTQDSQTQPTQSVSVQTDPTGTYPTIPVPTVSVPEGHEHSYGTWAVAQPVSCVQDQIIRRTCDACGQTEERIAQLATGIHSYDDAGHCSGCARYISMGLQYRLDAEGKAYVVMGIGTCTDTDIVIPQDHRGMPVTAIGPMAFASMGIHPSHIRSITIPATVTTIGSAAFVGCKQMTEILVDAGSGSFRSVDGVLYTLDGTTLVCYPDGLQAESFAVPQGVRCIGAYAFAYTTALKQIRMENDVESILGSAFSEGNMEAIFLGPKVAHIEFDAFSGCQNLKTITVHADNRQYTSDSGVLFTKNMTSLLCYPAGSQAQSYIIPDGVKSIASNAFQGCLNLEDLSLPDSVLEIMEDAFFECVSLKNVDLGDGLKTIGAYAFSWCSGLNKVIFGSRVTSVAEGAFHGCTGLQAVILPESLKSVGAYIFNGCDALKEIRYSGTAAQWGTVEKDDLWDGNAADYTFYCADVLSFSQGMEYELTWIDGVAGYALMSMGSCRDTNVVIPALYKGIPVTQIGQEVFNGLSNITSVQIPDSVVSIASTAFAHCYGLQKVMIGKGVQEIGMAAFLNCSSLMQITVSQENTAYKSIDGVLFSKDGTVLVAYPGGKDLRNYVLPEGVLTLGDFSFYDCDQLVTVECPQGMLTIGQEAFSDCDYLVSIRLPGSLASIGPEALYECDSLTTLYYAGSKDDWQSVQKGQLWSAASGSYVIECADGVIGTSGWTVIGTINGDNWTVDLPMTELVDGTWLTVQAYMLELGDTFQCRLDGSMDVVFPQEYFVVETPGVYYIHLDPVTGTIRLITDAR